MITDPWEQMILSIEPAYETYKAEIEMGPIFSVVTSTLSNVTWLYQIRIQDDWNFDTVDINAVIEWTKEQLESWPDCRRTSWDRWEFKNLRDTQKFETLFTLKWAR